MPSSTNLWSFNGKTLNSQTKKAKRSAISPKLIHYGCFASINSNYLYSSLEAKKNLNNHMRTKKNSMENPKIETIFECFIVPCDWFLLNEQRIKKLFPKYTTEMLFIHKNWVTHLRQCGSPVFTNNILYIWYFNSSFSSITPYSHRGQNELKPLT